MHPWRADMQFCSGEVDDRAQFERVCHLINATALVHKSETKTKKDQDPWHDRIPLMFTLERACASGARFSA